VVLLKGIEPEMILTHRQSGTLVGFDLREARSSTWTGEKRSLYLLRDDITRPLSVDPMVWPSCFPEVERTEWRGVLDHWSDLAVMFDAAARARIDQQVSRLIATEVMLEMLAAEVRAEWLSKHLEETSPSRLGPEWTLLGYDVADQWLLSGLSNCGYVRSERAGLQPKWAQRLNGHHLFRDPADAFAFAEVTNHRVPEHAPFFVYGLLERRGPLDTWNN